MIWSDEEWDRVRDHIEDFSAALGRPDYAAWLLWACLFMLIGLMMEMPQ